MHEIFNLINFQNYCNIIFYLKKNYIFFVLKNGNIFFFKWKKFKKDFPKNEKYISKIFRIQIIIQIKYKT